MHLPAPYYQTHTAKAVKDKPRSRCPFGRMYNYIHKRLGHKSVICGRRAVPRSATLHHNHSSKVNYSLEHQHRYSRNHSHPTNGNLEARRLPTWVQPGEVVVPVSHDIKDTAQVRNLKNPDFNASSGTPTLPILPRQFEKDHTKEEGAPGAREAYEKAPKHFEEVQKKKQRQAQAGKARETVAMSSGSLRPGDLAAREVICAGINLCSGQSPPYKQSTPARIINTTTGVFPRGLNNSGSAGAVGGRRFKGSDFVAAQDNVSAGAWIVLVFMVLSMLGAWSFTRWRRSPRGKKNKNKDLEDGSDCEVEMDNRS
ncbi:hypothetical protein BP5796_03012 [Coleophoma crateriformis]|uniref:Uncharacterized protein n=1 Tax=Coleophoma crateriformis TaxID=565419 RepID=A0A3D8SNE1_9HELO|nr:hypothetical protein BP5796_03012 [Coleophoma crateriformis]